MPALRRGLGPRSRQAARQRTDPKANTRRAPSTWVLRRFSRTRLRRGGDACMDSVCCTHGRRLDGRAVPPFPDREALMVRLREDVRRAQILARSRKGVRVPLRDRAAIARACDCAWCVRAVRSRHESRRWYELFMAEANQRADSASAGAGRRAYFEDSVRAVYAPSFCPRSSTPARSATIAST